MKNLCLLCAATVIVASISAASAAELSVPKSTLSSMGFSSVSVMSDNDGLAVRGKGTSASVWGEGTATKWGNTSTNGYAAAADHHHGSSTANGSNISYAGNVSGHGNHISFNINVAGGASSAYAK